MAQDIDCLDCQHCELIDDIYGVFYCDEYGRVWTGGACHDCDHYKPKDKVA